MTGDAYVDHPSFGMAIVGRLREAQGFRVGIIAQPDWRAKTDFQRLGKPNLFFGVTAGNMDSMINHYTADRKARHDDAYTPDNLACKRPDRATLIYTQRCKQAFSEVPVILGGIEASLRRIAHYDYWSDTVRRSVLVDANADMLIYGNGEGSEKVRRQGLTQGQSTVNTILAAGNIGVVIAQQKLGHGGGISYLFIHQVDAYPANGKRVDLLSEWTPPFAGFYLYYPSRKNLSPVLKAFVEFVRDNQEKLLKGRAMFIKYIVHNGRESSGQHE